MDVMVVDEVRRESMGRPWSTAAFDIATRVVLGIHLSLHAPSAVSVGLALAVTGLPKEQWLAERSSELDWPMFGLPNALHLDNAAEFHSVALSRIRWTSAYHCYANAADPLGRSLYAEIVRTLNTNIRPGMRYGELENSAVAMLKQAAPRMLIIDEIQHLLSCNARDQRAALNAIKYLANTMRMSIVAAGTHESLHAMRYDPQIASRFEQLELPLWGETEEFRCFVAGFIRTLPVRHTAGELDRRAIAYMLELTDGVTGRVVDLLRRAAKYALSVRSKRSGWKCSNTWAHGFPASLPSAPKWCPLHRQHFGSNRRQN